MKMHKIDGVSGNEQEREGNISDLIEVSHQ